MSDTPTLLEDIIPMFTREINPPGIELFSTISAGSKLGYIEDGFWDARLTGMFPAYTVLDGGELTVPLVAGKNYITDASSKALGLDKEFWMLISIFAGMRLIRLKIMNLAVNFKAVAGPVEYEQQASATTLRAILASMTLRINELKEQYSDDFSSGFFFLMDGVAQAEYSLANDLGSQQVVY